MQFTSSNWCRLLNGHNGYHFLILSLSNIYLLHLVCTISEYTFYESQFGFIYFQLERDAIDQHDYLVAHLEFLLFLKTLTVVYEPSNQRARQDLGLLMQKLGVQPFPPESRPNADEAEMRHEG